MTVERGWVVEVHLPSESAVVLDVATRPGVSDACQLGCSSLRVRDGTPSCDRLRCSHSVSELDAPKVERASRGPSSAGVSPAPQGDVRLPQPRPGSARPRRPRPIAIIAPRGEVPRVRAREEWYESLGPATDLDAIPSVSAIPVSAFPGVTGAGTGLGSSRRMLFRGSACSTLLARIGEGRERVDMPFERALEAVRVAPDRRGGTETCGC